MIITSLKGIDKVPIMLKVYANAHRVVIVTFVLLVAFVANNHEGALKHRDYISLSQTKDYPSNTRPWIDSKLAISRENRPQFFWQAIFMYLILFRGS